MARFHQRQPVESSFDKMVSKLENKSNLTIRQKNELNIMINHYKNDNNQQEPEESEILNMIQITKTTYPAPAPAPATASTSTSTQLNKAIEEHLPAPHIIPVPAIAEYYTNELAILQEYDY